MMKLWTTYEDFEEALFVWCMTGLLLAVVGWFVMLCAYSGLNLSLIDHGYPYGGWLH